MRSLVLALSTMIALALAVPAPAAAQTLWHPEPDQPSLRLELLHPEPDGRDNFDPDDFAGFLTLNVLATDGANLVIDLPFARASEDESTSSIGNPYIGVVLGAPSDETRYEFGARLPILDDDELGAWLLGLASDVMRFEAFAPEFAAAYAAVDWRPPLEDEHFRLRLRGGPTLWINTAADGAGEDNAELLIDYLGQLWYVSGAARVGGGLSGRLAATTDDLFDGRATHQLDLLGGYDFGLLEPGLLFRFPIDSIFDDSFVIGIWMEVELEL